MSGKQVKVMTPQESAAAAAAAALREEADENFKQFVLYIKPGDSNSENALRLLKSSPRLTQCVLQDVALLPSLNEGLDAYIPKLTYVPIANATHWVVHEQPERVQREITAFL